MTLRNIQWITDTGLLVGLTTIGEFAALPDLAALSFSTVHFTLAVPASGAILGRTPGSTVTAADLPAGFTLSVAGGWTYDGCGGGEAGSYTILLTETLGGAANSPLTTSITVSMASPDAMLDFSQSANSGVIAAIRSF